MRATFARAVNGGTFTGNYSGEYGGAIANLVGWLNVNGATFTGNAAADYGGAISVNDGGTITFSTLPAIGPAARAAR